MVVGEDFETSGYQRHLTDLGVDLAGVEVRSGVRSGHSYNVFDYENHGYCLSHLGVAAAQDDWPPPLPLIDGARALVVSEMFSPYTLAAIEHARGQGCMTAINGMVASAGVNAARFLAAADMLFLSRGEARDLQAALGVDDACRLLARGPRWWSSPRDRRESLAHRDGTTHVPAVPAASLSIRRAQGMPSLPVPCSGCWPVLTWRLAAAPRWWRVSSSRLGAARRTCRAPDLRRAIASISTRSSRYEGHRRPHALRD